MHQHANAWPDNIKVDPTELRWGSVLDLKNADLLVNVKVCELTLAVG